MVGILECIVVGWLFGTERLRRHINRVSSLNIGIWWDLLIRFFIPFILALIFVGDLYTELQKPYGGYSWTSLVLIGRDWLMVTLAAAFIIASRPWRTGHHKLEGRSSSVMLKE